MREIKFRGWCTNHKRMHYPMHQDDDLCWTTNDHDISDDGLHSYKIMQYIGLKDKNGKDVYEGDIVICSRGCPHEVIWMDEVPNQNFGGMPGFYLSDLMRGYSWMSEEEIIGNIYENPELLTQ